MAKSNESAGSIADHHTMCMPKLGAVNGTGGNQAMNPKQNIKVEDLSPMQRNALLAQALAELRRNPRNLDAYTTIAGLQGAEKNYDAAITTLLKALSLSKKNPDILKRIVGAANDKGDLPTARKYLRKLIEVQPKAADYYKMLALVHEKMGQPDDSIAQLHKALKLEPDSDEVLYGIGKSYSMKGDEAQATQYYQRALEQNPHHGMSLYAYSVARKFKGEEAEDYVRRLKAALSDPENRADGILVANLHYAAGKILEENGRYDEAFAEFRAANDARREEAAGKAPLIAFVNTFDAYTRDLLVAKKGLGNPSTKPVFILGMPRSGTTLTESLCAGHSQVTAGDEQLFITNMARGIGQRSNVPGAYRRNIEQFSSKDLNLFAQEYLASMKQIVGDVSYFTDKLPHNFMNIGFINLILPNAKIILCRRHPLDNCLSIYQNSMNAFHNTYKVDLTTLGIYFRQYCQLIDRWKAVLPGRIHEVFYEDLVANTELNARSMIDYIGLEWEDSVMDRQDSQRSVRTLSVWQVRQPVYQSSKGKWRNYEKHLGPLVEAIGPYIESYERELEALPAKDAA
jgi:tetratricopeptide (TPR) repeat protein